MNLNFSFKQTVKSAGGVFIKLENGTVFFCSGSGEKPLSLYAFSRTLENVTLSLKAHAEKLSLELWEQLIGSLRSRLDRIAQAFRRSYFRARHNVGALDHGDAS
jgi:hypothetical protein